jgi:hypothetical protein
VVNVTLTGDGAGKVTSNTGSPPIDCSLSGGVTSGACSTNPPEDFSTPTTMAAIATPGSVFGGWVVGGGQCIGTTTPCSLSTHFGGSFDLTATFITPPDPPIAFTDGSSVGAAAHLATLEGRVDPNGGGATTDCRFLYGPTTEYGQSAPCLQTAAQIGGGSGEVAVTAETEPLEANTTYHFRLRASNLGGAGQGKDRTFTTGPAPADGCTNADIRAEQGTEVALLPDCLALEQVSPSKKGNQSARMVLYPAVSPDGGRVLFNSTATLGNCPNVNIAGGDPFVASRGDFGWTIDCSTPPLSSEFGIRGAQTSYTPDLSGWFQIMDTAAGPRYFRESLASAPLAITPPLDYHGGAASSFQGASADLSHVYIKTGFKGGPGAPRDTFYLPGDPIPAGAGQDNNAYVGRLDSGGQPTLELLARDRDGKAWGANCGARLGGMEILTGQNLNLQNGERNQGAISADGSRVYFSTRPSQPASGACVEANRKRIMVREETPTGPVIAELIASECATVSRSCPGEATGNITSGSKIVANFTPSTPAGTFAPGMIVTRIGGTGVPANTKVAQILSPTELELTANATVTATGASLRANDGDDAYQGASVDQTKVYFTTTRQLLPGDLDGSSVASTATAGATSCSNSVAAGVPGCDLYLFDTAKPVGQRLTQVSLGGPTATTPGSGAAVRNSITAISSDGSHVYFVARTVLTTDPNPLGAVAQAAQNNLYLYTAANGELSFVGTLNSADGGNSGIFGGAANRENGAYAVPITRTDAQGNQVGGDGHVLLFRSKAPLTSGDADTSIDLYRYDAAADTLTQVSAAGPGGSDDGAFDVVRPQKAGSIGTDYAEKGRWVSEDGESVVFTTVEPLLPGDSNGAEDSYLWRDGQLFHLPGSTRSSISARANEPVLSHDGSTVAYHSIKRLTASDVDSTEDAYVLRSGGGFRVPFTPVCEGEACQGAPAPGPGASGVTSGSLASAGNVKATAAKCPKGKRKVMRAGKVRCVKRSKHKKQASHQKKRAGAKQGGQK